jgi:hypothetical protein
MNFTVFAIFRRIRILKLEVRLENYCPHIENYVDAIYNAKMLTPDVL